MDKEHPSILQFASLGMVNALCLGIGLAGGWFVDRALGTLPLFLFIGMVLGIVGGIVATRAEIKRFF